MDKKNPPHKLEIEIYTYDDRKARSHSNMLLYEFHEESGYDVSTTYKINEKNNDYIVEEKYKITINEYNMIVNELNNYLDYIYKYNVIKN